MTDSDGGGINLLELSIPTLILNSFVCNIGAANAGRVFPTALPTYRVKSYVLKPLNIVTIKVVLLQLGIVWVYLF